MFIGESRRPMGPGVLALQHEGYVGTGWSLTSRISMMAVRLRDRLVDPGEESFGNYLVEDETTGDLTGGALWREKSRAIPGWRFSWPVTTDSGRISFTPRSYTPPTGPDPTPRTPTDVPRTPVTPPPSRQVIVSLPWYTGYADANVVATLNALGVPITDPLAAFDAGNNVGFLVGNNEGWIPLPTSPNPWGTKRPPKAMTPRLNTPADQPPPAEPQDKICKEQTAKKAAQGKNAGAGGGKAGAPGNKGTAKEDDGKDKGANPFPGTQYGNEPPWPFGLNVDPYKVGTPGVNDLIVKRDEDGNVTFAGFRLGGGGAPGFQFFGIGVDPLGIALVSKPKKPRKKVAPIDKGHEEAAFYWEQSLSAASGGVLKAPPPLYPVADLGWNPDARYSPERNYSVPVDWPAIPLGFRGIVLTTTNENRQELLYHPTDPRLIAVNHGPDGAYGSLVCDTNAANQIDTSRMARLHSFFRVVVGPRGKNNCLKANDGRANWLSWNLGPAGNWDCHGGLVTDVSVETGACGDEKNRIHAIASVHEGGPFDVGRWKDVHQQGRDADGFPINSLHLSTRAPFIRHPGDGNRDDGPLFFELIPFREGGDLDEPLAVHLSFDSPVAYWKWWTTTTIVTPPQTPVPEQPPPTGDDDPPTTTDDPPPSSGTPRGGTYSADGSYIGIMPNPAENAPGWREAQDVSTFVVTNSARIGDASFASTSQRFPNRQQPASGYREHAFPSLSFRPQRIAPDEVDLRFARGRHQSEKNRHDLTTPTVIRMESYGAQGGRRSGPYLLEPTGPGENVGGEPWAYRQSPSASRHVGGTAPGGLAFLTPERDMQHTDAFVLTEHVETSHYVMVTPGVAFGLGVPELASGGLRDGFSFEYDEPADQVVWYSHDEEGNRLAVMAISEYGYARRVVHTSTSYSVQPGDNVIIVEDSATITLPPAAGSGVRGVEITVKANTNRNVTVTDPTSTIDGAASQTINQRYDSMMVVSDGTEWFII